MCTLGAAVCFHGIAMLNVPTPSLGEKRDISAEAVKYKSDGMTTNLETTSIQYRVLHILLFMSKF